MTWKHASSLASSQHSKRGIQASLIAGSVCLKAEKDYNGLFHAVSIKNRRMHIEIEQRNLVNFKLVEGKILKEVQAFSEAAGLPRLTGFTLTVLPS